MPGSPDWDDFHGAPAQMQKAQPGRDLSQALPEDLFAPAESADVESTYQGQEFRRGQSVWYRQRDGTWAPAEVVAVDQSITPPSYGIKMGDIIRETESPRLRHRAARDFEPPKWLQFSGGQEPAAHAAAPQQLPSRLGPGHQPPSSAQSARSASDAAIDWAAWEGTAATEAHPAAPAHWQQQPAWHQARQLDWPAERAWQQGQLDAAQVPMPRADPFAGSAFNRQLTQGGAGAGRPAAGEDPFAGSPTIMLGLPGAAQPTVAPAATQQRWQPAASLPQPQTSFAGALPSSDGQKQPLQAHQEAGFMEAGLGDASGAGQVQVATPQPQAGFAGAWAGSSIMANGAHANDKEDDFGDFAEADCQAAAPQQHAGSQHKEAGPRQGPIALSIFGEEDLEDLEMPGLQVGPVWAPPWESPVKPGQARQQDAAPSSGLGGSGALPLGVTGRWQHAPGGSPVARSGQVGTEAALPGSGAQAQISESPAWGDFDAAGPAPQHGSAGQGPGAAQLSSWGTSDAPAVQSNGVGPDARGTDGAGMPRQQEPAWGDFGQAVAKPASSTGHPAGAATPAAGAAGTHPELDADEWGDFDAPDSELAPQAAGLSFQEEPAAGLDSRLQHTGAPAPALDMDEQGWGAFDAAGHPGPAAVPDSQAAAAAIEQERGAMASAVGAGLGLEWQLKASEPVQSSQRQLELNGHSSSVADTAAGQHAALAGGPLLDDNFVEQASPKKQGGADLVALADDWLAEPAAGTVAEQASPDRAGPTGSPGIGGKSPADPAAAEPVAAAGSPPQAGQACPDEQGGVDPVALAADWRAGPAAEPAEGTAECGPAAASLPQAQELAQSSAEIREAYVEAWTQLMRAAAELLHQGQQLWSAAVAAGSDQELLSSSAGMMYFSALRQVYFVVLLLQAAADHYGAGEAEDLVEASTLCTAGWRGDDHFSDGVQAAAMAAGVHFGDDDLLFDARAAVQYLVGSVPSSPVVGGQPPSPPRDHAECTWAPDLCALTLLPLDALPTIAPAKWAQQRQCLAPVGNLWLHHVSPKMCELP